MGLDCYLDLFCPLCSHSRRFSAVDELNLKYGVDIMEQLSKIQSGETEISVLDRAVLVTGTLVFSAFKCAYKLG